MSQNRGSQLKSGLWKAEQMALEPPNSMVRALGSRMNAEEKKELISSAALSGKTLPGISTFTTSFPEKCNNSLNKLPTATKPFYKLMLINQVAYFILDTARWSLRSLPSQAFLWFYNSLFIFLFPVLFLPCQCDQLWDIWNYCTCYPLEILLLRFMPDFLGVWEWKFACFGAHGQNVKILPPFLKQQKILFPFTNT